MKWAYVTVVPAVVMVILGINFAFDLYGEPTEFRFTGVPPFFFGITWQSENEGLNEQPIILPPKIYDIYIDSFESGQQVYKPGDNSTIYFEIINGLNVSYNITVDWLYNDTRYHGWNTVSTSYYNITEPINYWSSWYNISEVGEWEAHLVVDYSLNNNSFSKDKIIKFRVI